MTIYANTYEVEAGSTNEHRISVTLCDDSVVVWTVRVPDEWDAIDALDALQDYASCCQDADTVESMELIDASEAEVVSNRRFMEEE